MKKLYAKYLVVVSIALFLAQAQIAAGEPPIPVTSFTAIPATINYCRVETGKTSSVNLTVKNTGNVAMTVTNIALSGTGMTDFQGQDVNCLNNIINPSGTCTITAGFTPASTDRKDAALVITTDDPDSPTLNVTLIGNDSCVTSSNAVVTEQTITKTVANPPANYTPQIVTGFTATNVVGSADISIYFDGLAANSVFYKVVNGGWKQIYPANQCNGISNVALNSNVLSFTIADNSECDANNTAGIIYDPVVAGTSTTPAPEPASGGGGGGCSIGKRPNSATSVADAAVLFSPLLVFAGLWGFRRRKK